MFEKLKQTAQDLFGGDEVERILALPITQVRLDLKQAFNKKSFSAEDFESIVTRLQQIDPTIARQLDVVRKAMADRAVDDALDIELDTPAKTALWAAAFMRLMEDGKEPLAKSRIWSQMQDSIGLFNEGIRVAKVISASLQNNEVTFDWGQPGTWFYYDPRKNHINLDMFMTLMMGFEHMRVVHLHEIGHSELSNSFPPRMRALYDKVKAVIDPASLTEDETKALRAKPKATAQEQLQMMADVNEWQLRFMLWHMVEDNCVNQFAVNMEKILPIQDFAASWNHIGVALQGYGELARGDSDKMPEDVTSDMPRARSIREKVEQTFKDMAEAERKKQQEALQKLVNNPLSDADVKAIKSGKISPEIARRMFHMNKTIVWLSFYERTGLFRDNDKGWAKFKVFKDDVNRTVDVSAIPEAKGMSAFDYLYQMSVGAKGISSQQPRPADRMFGKQRYKAKVEETTEARNALMEKIWDIYLKTYADVLIAENQQKMQNRQQQKQQQQQGGQGQQQQDQNQQGNQQSQQGQPQQGNGDQQQGNDGTPQKSQGGGMSTPGDDAQGGGGQQDAGQENKSGGKDEKPQDDKTSGGDQKDQDKKDDQPSPDEKQTSQSNQQKEELDEELQERMKDMAATPQDKKEQEHAEDEKAAKAEAEKAKDQQDTPEAPEQDKAQDNKPGWQQDPDAQGQPKKADDLKDQAPVGEDMSQEQKDRLREALDAMKSGGPSGKGMGAGTSAHDVDLTKLAKGDWRDFEKRAIELAPVVNQIARSFEKIRDKQRRDMIKISKSDYEFQAQDGDFQSRFDRDKRLDRVFKMQSGQKVEVDDFKNFHDDVVKTTPSSIEMTFMIDGSGSMPSMKLAGGVTAMEAALQSAAIMYLAARKVGIDAYIIMWGNRNPLVVATPESTLKEVGRELEGLRNGINSATDLSPALRKTIGTMADYKPSANTISGSSHIFVYSDGDIGDASDARQDLEKVARYGRNVSVDVAVFRPNVQDSKTAMERTFEGVISETGSRNIGTLRGNDPNEMPRELARTVLRRVNAIQIKGEPDAIKRRHLKSLHNKMTS